VLQKHGSLTRKVTFLRMTMTNTIKSIVSKKKRRFIEDGFNLDLTYISDRVIAMGYPSENVESIYRNNLEDVRRLLEKKHKDHYKIYNLCSERSYDIQKFHNRVATYPFDDHNPPEFAQMQPFCADVDKWLDENEANVAVVHCKAGKGRTGLMICAYLLHRRIHLTAEEVLKYYGDVRTVDQKGVTIPSQRRYVDYFAAVVSEGLQYNPVKMYLTSIVIDPLPQLGLGQHEGYIQFEVRQTSVRPFLSDVYLVKRTDGRINIELQNALLIVGDVKIDFTQKIKLDFLNISKGPKGFSNVPNGKLFHFWVNTFFIDQQRSSTLTHDSTVSSSLAGRSGPTTSIVSSPGNISHADIDRNCRSTHNSGGDLGQDSPLPPPRLLRPTVSVGEPRVLEPSGTNCFGSGEERNIQEDEQSEETSPNGSCPGSVQTIHCHPPARTVSIVGQASTSHSNNNGLSDRRSQSDRVNMEQATAELKVMSVSGDYLAEQAMRGRGGMEPGYRAGAVDDATHESFIAKRHRHSSVPQTAKSGQVTGQGSSSGALTGRPRRYIPPGRMMSVRLNKSQIDKASKDKSGKFSDNFNVTLFLVRPNDQTLQDEFSRSNLICQGVEPPGGAEGGSQEIEVDASSEESSEEEPELRSPRPAPLDDSWKGPLVGQGQGAERGARTLTDPVGVIHGMVRNYTEPGPGGSVHRLSDMGLSQSTWI